MGDLLNNTQGSVVSKIAKALLKRGLDIPFNATSSGMFNPTKLQQISNILRAIQ
jgi:hypothetical protein